MLTTQTEKRVATDPVKPGEQGVVSHEKGLKLGPRQFGQFGQFCIHIKGLGQIINLA